MQIYLYMVVFVCNTWRMISYNVTRNAELQNYCDRSIILFMCNDNIFIEFIEIYKNIFFF